LLGIGVASKDKNDERSAAGNRWGQYRRPVACLKRAGEEILLGGPSNNTVGDLQIDYSGLLWDVRQLDQYVKLKREKGVEPTAEAMQKDLSDLGILIGDGTTPGYATRSDLETFVKAKPTLFEYTRDLMAKKWHLSRSTIDTYLKPRPKKSKNQ
jgi:hypothetical protein